MEAMAFMKGPDLHIHKGGPILIPELVHLPTDGDMEHRNSSNSFRMPMHQGHVRNNLTAEQSYIPMGRAIAPENGALVNPMDSVSRGRVQSASQWNSQSGASDYPSSSFSMGIPHIQPPGFPGPSYDPFQRSSAAGNIHLAPQNHAGHAYSNFYDRRNIHGNQSGLLDSGTGSGRRPYKRKIPPGISVACERGSPSGFYSAGSSSSTSILPMGKPTSGYQNIPSGHVGSPHYGGGGLPVAGEDMGRNVRTRLDLEANPIRSHLSSYSSHHYHLTTNSSSYHGADEVANINADETPSVWNLNALPHPAHGLIQPSGTNGLSHESNQFRARGSCTEICGVRPDSVSGRNFIPSSQYLLGAVRPDSVSGRNLIPSFQYSQAPAIWGPREGGASHSQRAIPSYGPGLSYPQFGHEAASTVSALQSLSESYSSRYSRMYAGGWPNSHRNGRSRMATEQFQSMPSIVDAYDRIGSENVMMINMSLLDQYGDMRLDVDNMSYEELLALGERIGNVSTGLSEDMISKCLTETKKASEQNHQEGTCCICLEEYADEEVIGTLKKCGHNYHASCIREWLLLKNACPVCKAPALTDHSK